MAGDEDLQSVFAQRDDHRVHVAEGHPRPACKACQFVPRWKVTQIGIIWQSPMGWRDHGWEFDRSTGWAWVHQDMVAIAAQSQEIAMLPEIAEEDRNARPRS